jgi:hypothetical protein
MRADAGMRADATDRSSPTRTCISGAATPSPTPRLSRRAPARRFRYEREEKAHALTIVAEHKAIPSTC